MVEISWRDFTKIRGPLDLAKVQGDYDEEHSEVRSSGGSRAVDLESQGPLDPHVTSHIGDSRGEVPSLCNKYCDIARSDIPIGSEPSIVWDACQEIPRSRGSENRGFARAEETCSLKSRSAISRRRGRVGHS
jgi:hypothetical protein